MKALLAAALLLAALAGPAPAKTVAVPSGRPVITLEIPDRWVTATIDDGVRATEPGDDVILYVEATRARDAEALGRLNAAWMREQGIIPGSSREADVRHGGLPGRMIRYQATDQDGDTTVTFIALPAGPDRFIQITVWGADAAERRHGATLSGILESIKAID